MEPMLPQSLGGSDSEILGVGDVMMNSPDMNAGLMPANNGQILMFKVSK